MVTYLLPIDFSSLKQSKPAIQVILGSLKILNESNVHDQPIFLNSFTSEVVINDLAISNITLDSPSIEIISSEFNMTDVSISNIQTVEEGSF